MNIALVNDILGGCLGEEKVFWNLLLDAFPDMVGVDWSKVGKAAFERSARQFIDEAFHGEPALVIQNATFLDRVAPDLPTIAFLQDNLRAMGRPDPRQEAVLKGATVVVANSVLTAASYPECQCRVIPIGIDESLFRPAEDRAGLRSKHGLPGSGPVGIFVGAFNDVKGWPQVRAALEAHPEVFFLLVTKFGETFEAPNARTFSKINQHTLAELHGCADFFILGSPVETQCLAALEASFCGLPVIMNETGIYMDFPDRDQFGTFGVPFAEAIPKVLAARWDTRSRILTKGLSIRDMISRWKALLEDVHASVPMLQPRTHIPSGSNPTAGRAGVALSVLVCSLPNRAAGCLPNLLADIHRQISDRKDVEVLVLYDNWRRTVGRKRDDLIRMATGRFLTFIDDDDRIAPDYFDEILGVIDTYETSGESLDCIVFDTHFRKLDHGQLVDEYNCQYGIEFDYVKDARGWFGKPAHTMVWRSAIAKSHHFSDIPWGEDVDWVKRACRDIRDQHRIPKVLYHYDWNIQESESDLHNWNRFNPVKEAPIPTHPGPRTAGVEHPVRARREGFIVSPRAWTTGIEEVLSAYFSAFRKGEPIDLILLASSEDEARALADQVQHKAALLKEEDIPDHRILPNVGALPEALATYSRLHRLMPSVPLAAGSFARRMNQALGR